MDFNGFSTEVQNFIQKAEQRHRAAGILEYDTCQKLLKCAAETNSDGLFGMSYYYFAEYYWKNDDLENTMHCLTECTKYFRTAEMYELLAKTYNMMGAVSDRQNNRVVALNYYYSSLQYAEKYGYIYVRAMVESNIGYILMRMKRYREALERYESSIRCYRQSQNNIFRNYNLAMCIVNCGFCYMNLLEQKKALKLWEQIVRLKEAYPEDRYPWLNIKIFEAECEEFQGNREKAYQCLDEIMAAVEKETSLADLMDNIVDLAALLNRLGACGLQEKLFQLLEERGLETQAALFLDLYPYRSECLWRNGRREEYVQFTCKYFNMYQQLQQNSRQVTVKMIELRDKLLLVEKEQSDILADNRKLESIVLYDSMTNLANRTFLNEHLSEQFEEAQAQKKIIGVEIMDIDYFKQYNDTYGHLLGDSCIEAVAGVLKETENENIFCARYGGDEFVIIYSNMEIEEIRSVADTIQKKVIGMAIPHKASGCAPVVTVSQGIFAKTPEDFNREWDYSSMADISLYKAKREGRNRLLLTTEFSPL